MKTALSRFFCFLLFIIIKIEGPLSSKIFNLIKNRKYTACILIFCQLFNISAVAAAPFLQSSSLPAAPHEKANSQISNSLDPPIPSTQKEHLPNLSLTNQELGLSGPLSFGATYSDLTGTYLNAQYALALNERFAMMALGEYGSGQYRLSGTLGYGFSPLTQLKLSAERLDQRLPFQFDSGNIDQRIHQDAYGLRVQHQFEQPFLQALNLGGYFAQAANKNLSPQIFISNGSNCAGNQAGLTCINYRYIAGASSSGMDFGAEILLTPSTLIEGTLYYDQVRYNTRMTDFSPNDRYGLGGAIKINQLLSKHFKFFGEASLREIYDNYQGGISWLSPIRNSGIELSLFGQHLVSHNTTPDNNSVSLKISWLPESKKLYENHFEWGNKQAIEVGQWVKTPAIYMEQVLAVAEQVTRLLAPAIQSIVLNHGPFSGGNIVTITGSNFTEGMLVFIGGQLATAITILSNTTLTATVPAAQSTSTTTLTVDVVVENPDGQKAALRNGYTYTRNPVPTITGLNPNQGPDTGGTTVTITGNNLTSTESITFDGFNATNIVVINDTTLTAVTPSHSPGSVNVSVTTTFGNVTLTNGYTYISTLASTNPENAIKDIGQTAVFSTIATGGVTPYSYQWQVSTDGGTTFNNVSTGTGGTTASYTTASLTLSDNNNRYRVLVSDATSASVTTAAATLTVNSTLSSTDPATAIKDVGQTATFSTTASGGTTPYSYQWQVSTDGGTTFNNVSTGTGGTTASYTTASLTLSDNNNRYRVLVSDATSASVTTAAATLTVNSTLSSTDPATAIKDVGQTATFSTTASGGTTPYSYQWQVSTDGGTTFNNVSTGTGGTTASYTTASLTLSDNNNRYRVLVSDATSASVTTAAATLTVNSTLSSTDPATAIKDVGQTATFSTTASGGTTPYSYQWQVSTDGGTTFNNVSTGTGGTTASYTTASLTLSDNNNRYRVLVSDATSASVTTAAATLTVNSTLSSTDPATAIKDVGQTATFSTTASGGTTPYSYQWQVSTDGGTTFNNVSTGTGGTTASYTTASLTLSDNNNRYRVLVSDATSASVTTAAATLTVNSTLSSTDPATAIKDVGQTATFSTTASGGTTPYSYQWQVSTDGGTTFNNVSTGTGGTTASYTTASLTLGNNNNRYRVLVSDAASASVTTAAAILTVNSALSSTNPSDALNISPGATATFNTTTSGGTTPYSYQWQVSNDGGVTFSNVTTGTGGTTSSYTTPPMFTDAEYRVIVTDTAGAIVTTSAALLTIASS
ncbi:IPT/TIG domain-containing protein [Legionella sp. PATHC038]|uniref:IPT/TIG domain-containing protein n=1 Tax=Legionella sheltonii TaxID=2992041 RepID=UPI00224467FC|nr:IPT/TIG domain-containing protein [Legionella sp. PATHC038]MCW8398412.1 IPT/TIG domain-containing protein [Legionella sp. PATHC038]